MSQSILPNIYEFIAIVCMASTTYFTRIIGYVYLRKRKISPRIQYILESSPCCVMVAVAAPAFMTTDWKTLVALFAALIIAFRFNLAITIVASVAIMAMFHVLFP